MRQDLEDLWNYYLIEVPIKNTKKEICNLIGVNESE